jgi:hypothetical protein
LISKCLMIALLKALTVFNTAAQDINREMHLDLATKGVYSSPTL